MRKTGCRLFSFLLIVLPLLPLDLQAADTRPTTAYSAPDEERRTRGVHLDEFGIGSGYAWGKMKYTSDSFRAVPAYLRIGFDMNPLLGMRASKGTRQLAIEPFANTVTSPDKGIELGLDVFVRYLHPIMPSVKLVSEIGSGPMYLCIDTREQGKAGFNFLNQFGLGTQVALSEKCAVTFGYRFLHLSNAGIRQPNGGINSNMLSVSVSALY